MRSHFVSVLIVVFFGAKAFAGVGDPQIMTDHSWYPGELAFSTFERMAATQAVVYERVTGKAVKTDEDKALASWLWRNTHYAHGEEGAGDYFDQGFQKRGKNTDYWHGLFAHGFGLCGTTHSQWCAEMEYLLGPCRGRVVGVKDHNSFEVWLTGGEYGKGRWALLDHDVSTVIFDDAGKRLLSIREVMPKLNQYSNPRYKPDRQRGWRVAGLHDGDAKAYSQYRFVEYQSGYAAAPPIVHLRCGEVLRRYHEPGLDDEKTFVFWGRNYNVDGIPGPSRDRSWVNQPEKIYRSKNGAGWTKSRVRYANALYLYKPNFKSGSYKEGVIDESDSHVTFEFYTPYVIGATPPNDKPWGIYDKGCRNALTLIGDVDADVSTDQGHTWHKVVEKDATDLVKGHQQYWIRFNAGAKKLAGSGLTIRTVCQANVAVLPRLHDGDNRITFAASGNAIVSAGPNLDQAKPHIIEGAIESPSITMKLNTPRGEKVVGVYAASWNASGVPPRPAKYNIEFSTDGQESFRAILKDWKIVQRKPEPNDWWSQSIAYGGREVEPASGPVFVRFSNTGRIKFKKIQAHLVYRVRQPSPTEVTFAWRNEKGFQKASHRYASGADADRSWVVQAGRGVQMKWVEFRCANQ